MKKKSKIIIILGIVLVLVLTVGLLVNPLGGTRGNEPYAGESGLSAEGNGADGGSSVDVSENDADENVIDVEDGGTGSWGSIFDMNQSEAVNEEILASLSHLQTPYVGNASAVGAILYAMQLPGEEWRLDYFEIGVDFLEEDSHAPYTLLVHYILEDPSVQIAPSADTQLEREAFFLTYSNILFELIDNLQEVTFSFRPFVHTEVHFGHHAALGVSAGYSESQTTVRGSGTMIIYQDPPYIEREDSIAAMLNPFGLSVLSVENDAQINQLNSIYEVDFRDLLAEQFGEIFNNHDPMTGSLLIQTVEPIYNVQLVTLYQLIEGDETIFLPRYGINGPDSLNSGEGFMIHGFFDHGLHPRGILFQDSDENFWLFGFNQNQTDDGEPYWLQPWDVAIR